MSPCYHVYITSSWSRCLYIGVTGDLVARVGQHKGLLPRHKGFTSLHRAHRLVFMEATAEIHSALAREKQLKRWRRERKLALISSFNPEWRDLAAHWTTNAWPER